MAIDWDALVLSPTMAAFAEPAGAVVSWAGGVPIAIPDAVFDRQHVEVSFGDRRAPISGVYPVLGIRASQLPGDVQPAQLDHVECRGTEYMVVDVQPDGLGHILLILATP